MEKGGYNLQKPVLQDNPLTDIIAKSLPKERP